MQILSKKFFLESVLADILDISLNKYSNFIKINEIKLVQIGTYESYYGLFIDFYKTIELDKYEFKMYNSDLEAKALISSGAGLDNYDSTGDLLIYNCTAWKFWYWVKLNENKRLRFSSLVINFFAPALGSVDNSL